MLTAKVFGHRAQQVVKRHLSVRGTRRSSREIMVRIVSLQKKRIHQETVKKDTVDVLVLLVLMDRRVNMELLHQYMYESQAPPTVTLRRVLAHVSLVMVVSIVKLHCLVLVPMVPTDSLVTTVDMLTAPQVLVDVLVLPVTMAQIVKTHCLVLVQVVPMDQELSDVRTVEFLSARGVIVDVPVSMVILGMVAETRQNRLSFLAVQLSTTQHHLRHPPTTSFL